MVNYYEKFLPDLATTLGSLYQLLKKSIHWSWGGEQSKTCYSQVESSRTSIIVCLLSCDASPYGLGAVLSHQIPDGTERPASCTLTKAEMTILFEGKDNANADALSRLLLPSSQPVGSRPAEVVHLMEYLDFSPLSIAQIR